MLNNPSPSSFTPKKGFHGYTLLDCTQETTQMMSVIDNAAFPDFVKAFGSELNNHMHFCPTEPYIYLSIEIDTRKKLFGLLAVSENEINTDFSNEVKSQQPRIPKLICDPKRKQLVEEFFLSSVPLNSYFQKISISQNLTTDSELQHVLTVLVENDDIFSKFTYVFGKISQDFHVKRKMMLHYRSVDLPRFLCIIGIDWNFS